ncbi:YndJ family transporter [Haliscomenobacter sp.]|uniref:YndJ family transporter n=1 Tax=Haliscomenobacter sp. TaxID=2717303 RepID=UPI003364BFDD
MKSIYLLSNIGFFGFWVYRGILHPLEKDWVELLIVLAAMVLIPIVLQRTGIVERQREQIAVALAAWALLAAYTQQPGVLAAILSLPWLLVSILTLGKALQNFLLSNRDYAEIALFSAYLFFPVGTIAAFSDRLSWTPLGFSPIIILLTAAHFHYAGFLLPWIAAQVLSKARSRVAAQVLSLLIVSGIPAVALGITLSQFDAPVWIETAAATIMASGGIVLAVWHVCLAFEKNSPVLRRSGQLGIAGCLFLGMTLALLYGWRTYFPLPFLSIPWMYALHGSVNTLGVGILGVWVWSRVDRF